MITGPGGEDDGSLVAALFNRRRQWLPLSPDQIRIVDEFVAGRLAGEAAAAAERLVRDNAFAAERVMERRLLQQAESSPAPPRAVTESILRGAQRAATRRSAVKRPLATAWLSWKTVGIVGIAAAAMVLGSELLLNPLRSPTGTGQAAKEANNDPNDPASSVQVAMATIANRDLLLEASDGKLRGEAGRSSAGNANPRKTPETSERVVPRVYDIEVPSDLLAGWLARATAGSQIPSAELAPLVGGLQTFKASQNIAILFDEALRTRIAETPPGVQKQTSVTALRVYDLGQQPADDLLKGISIKTGQKLAPGYFVTLRP
jgi:hypothetical protein